MDAMYGCLNLHSAPIPLAFPFKDNEGFRYKQGYHIGRQKKEESVAGEYIFAGHRLQPTVHVPSRDESIDSMMMGEIVNPLGMAFANRLLLTINSERNDLTFPDLIHERLMKRLSGSFLVCISQSGPHSNFIFLINNIELNIVGVVSDKQTMLVWSNESRLEERMREESGNKFFYYRFPTMNKGSLVLQTAFLCNRFRRWQAEAKDKLKIFSAIERQVIKNLRS
jgi:hypothetical protein